jgi:hypothetical protein
VATIAVFLLTPPCSTPTGVFCKLTGRMWMCSLRSRYRMLSRLDGLFQSIQRSQKVGLYQSLTFVISSSPGWA